jgi:hypothetical protein
MPPEPTARRLDITPAIFPRTAISAAGLIVALWPAVCLPVTPDVSVFSNARELADLELNDMRGRFVAGGAIVQFGVEMVTTWHTTVGQTLRAGAELRVGNLQNGNPSVAFIPVLSINEPRHSDPIPLPRDLASAQNGSTALRGANGVVQVIQVAGDQNTVNQTAAISASSAPLAEGPNSGLAQAAPVTHSMVRPSGAAVSVTLERKGMSVQASVPGQGIVLQQIRGTGSAAGGAPGLVQTTRLLGDFHTVHSSVLLRIQTAATRPSGAAVMAPSMLQGIRPVGAF